MAEKETEKEEIEQSFNLAAAKHKEGDLEQAEYIYFNILSVNPKHIKSNYNLGLLLASKGMYKEALAFIGRALILNPLDVGCWKDYADCISKISASGDYSSDLKTAVNNYIDTALLFIHNKLLVPDQSDKLGKPLDGQNILLLGTCQAEFLLETAKIDSGCNIDHFFLKTAAL